MARQKTTGTLIKKTKADQVFDVFNILICGLITLIMVYPLYFTVIVSLSSPGEVASGSVFLWPKGFTLEAYQNVFRNKEIWVGYRNTILYTVGNTLYCLGLTIPAAYVLTKKYLPFRGAISWYFFVTMYFGGGLIPRYILNKALHLVNTPWIMIVGVGVSCYNLIVTRTFFSSNIPDELYESAYIDGATEWQSFIKIALPLSGSILAVMILFNVVGCWNSYYTAMIYITNQNYWPLQMVLRKILILGETAALSLEEMTKEEQEWALRQSQMIYTMKYALIFISSAPLLVIYPFVQKHFVKGVMIGSVKG